MIKQVEQLLKKFGQFCDQLNADNNKNAQLKKVVDFFLTLEKVKLNDNLDLNDNPAYKVYLELLGGVNNIEEIEYGGHTYANIFLMNNIGYVGISTILNAILSDQERTGSFKCNIFSDDQQEEVDKHIEENLNLQNPGIFVRMLSQEKHTIIEGNTLC